MSAQRRPCFVRRSPGQSTAGFTLVEMLVVLLLVAMASTLMYQGLAYFLSLRERVAGMLERQGDGSLRRHWITSSIAGLYPDYDQPAGGVAGSARSLTGLTIAPLDGTGGAPTPFGWHIAAGARGFDLVYAGDNRQRWTVHSWTGSGAHFSYQDEQGDWHADWPPRASETADLPSTIALHVPDGDSFESWIVHVAISWAPPETLDFE